MTADLTSKIGARFQVQIATMTIPYINDAEVRFCRFLEADHSTKIGISQAHFYAQFGDTKAKWLDAPSIVHSEFETFDYPILPINFNVDVHEKLKERSKSFVRFATEASSHSGRRQFVTELADKGINARVIQALARHKHLNKTMRYIDINENKMRSAIDLVNYNR